MLRVVLVKYVTLKCCALALVLVAFGTQHGVSAKPDSSRYFEFEYSVTLKALRPGADVKLWIPIADSSREQEIESVEFSSPVKVAQFQDKNYGNKIGFFRIRAAGEGDAKFRVLYRVRRHVASSGGAGQGISQADKRLFLAANSRVPVGGRPARLVLGHEVLASQFETGRKLYELVLDHMTYDKSKPGYGLGDAVWACDSKTGNCTDFHSLFISLARYRSIPAKFEIGFPLPVEKTEGRIAGYHCWAWFFSDQKGWTPVDISEADKNPRMAKYYFGKLTADRFAVSVGRDIVLQPASKSGPKNYFVYPHVEIDGVALASDAIDMRFSFRDLKNEADQ